MNKKATFAAGCFWGIEEAFGKVKGVTSTTVGYTGGTTEKPTYHDVCTGTTGHAEAVEVEYDPNVVSYDELLNIFWNIHNPSEKNRQGPDIGTQYRSVIFYHDDEQKKQAEKSLAALKESGKYRDPIATEISGMTLFFAAEQYHQKYLQKQKGTCKI